MLHGLPVTVLTARWEGRRHSLDGPHWHYEFNNGGYWAPEAQLEEITEPQPEPEPLPWSAVAETAAAALMAQALGLLLPQVKAAAAGYSNQQAELLTIQLMDDLGVQLRGMAATRARNAIYAGLPAAHVAKALGITRQAASKRFSPGS
jgi:hypothetical protein